jgi:hypothetical protein
MASYFFLRWIFIASFSWTGNERGVYSYASLRNMMMVCVDVVSLDILNRNGKNVTM